MLNYLTKFPGEIEIEPLKKKINQKSAALSAENETVHLFLENITKTNTKLTVLDGAVTIDGSFESNSQKPLESVIESLIPWRKGPFSIMGTYIDAEWRSDQKWKLLENLTSLKGKTILDIGCNNGYYMFRMLQEDPAFVLGIDPVLRCKLQFDLVHRLSGKQNVAMELLGHEDLDSFKSVFDIVYCLGIIYHTTDPILLLRRIHRSLRVGGELFLESQGIASEETIALVPGKTYAGAGGHWFVPSASCLVNWLHRSGFREIEVFHTHKLTPSEQRKTRFCPFDSLEEALSPENPQLTIEGYPAPIRIYVRARK